MKLELFLLGAASCAALALACPSQAVLNDTGHTNISAPANDPGWDYVGQMGGLNGVYVGYGWVLSAAHVGAKPVAKIGPIEYPMIAESRVVFMHDATTEADLQAIKIDPYPTELAPLAIRATTPPIGTPVILIGRGKKPLAEIPQGWTWDTSSKKRWGTNLIGGTVDVNGNPVFLARAEVTLQGRTTMSLVTEFTKDEDPAVSSDECVVTSGDSGGGLFIETSPGSGTWELAGIQTALGTNPGQPANTSYYKNDTFSVDLSHYHEALLDVIRPCDDGRDNDGDGLSDDADPECVWAGDDSEEPACSDGIDNDFDGLTDFGEDPDCMSADGLAEVPDLDGDGIGDSEDNCLDMPNTSQLDTDADGFGNACDADYNNDLIVAGPDFIDLSGAQGSVEGEPNYAEEFDADGDGSIGGTEFILLSSSYAGPPGPSGLACAGTAPCP